jgi:hypothetical protein
VWMGLVKTTMKRFRDDCWPMATAEGKRTLAAMQVVLDDMEVPSNVCRIISKFASNMSRMNAAQLRTFATSLSGAVFAGRLSPARQRQWDHLVSVAAVITAPYLRVRPASLHRARRAAAGGSGLRSERGSADDSDDVDADYVADGSDSDNETVENQARKRDRGDSTLTAAADDIVKVTSFPVFLVPSPLFPLSRLSLDKWHRFGTICVRSPSFGSMATAKRSRSRAFRCCTSRSIWPPRSSNMAPSWAGAAGPSSGTTA